MWRRYGRDPGVMPLITSGSAKSESLKQVDRGSWCLAGWAERTILSELVASGSAISQDLKQVDRRFPTAGNKRVGDVSEAVMWL